MSGAYSRNKGARAERELCGLLLACEHDPSCRTVAGLESELRRVYGVSSLYSDTVTIVDFHLPQLTLHESPTPPNRAEGV